MVSGLAASEFFVFFPNHFLYPRTFDCIAPTAQIPALSQIDVYEENLSNLI